MPRPRRVSARNAARGARTSESPKKTVGDKPSEPQEETKLEKPNEPEPEKVVEMEVDPPEPEPPATEPEPTPTPAPEAPEPISADGTEAASEITAEPIVESDTKMETSDETPETNLPESEPNALAEIIETNHDTRENSTEPISKPELTPKEDPPAEEVEKKPDVTKLEEKGDEAQPKLATRLLRARRKPRMEISDDEVPCLLRDDSFLINVSLGYGPTDNLKLPLKGFTADDEVKLFPVIDSMSSKLFTIVQKMTDDQKRDIEAACVRRKGIIKICEFPKAFLYHMKYRESPTDSDKVIVKRPPHPFLTEDENIFSEEKLKILRAVLDAGWKREVVMRSVNASGRKTGDVYYYSPTGTKYRSSKQIAQHLATYPDTPFTVDNFSFAKVRISTNPDQEIVRKAYDGKSPPRTQPKGTPPKSKSPPPVKPEPAKPVVKPSSSKESTDTESRPVEEPVKAAAGRRAIQPPKRYSGDAVLLLPKRSKTQDDKYSRGSHSNKGLMQMGMLPPKYPKGMEDSSSNLNDMEESMRHDMDSNSVAMKELAEDSLFQISALRQSGRIDVDKMRQYVESQKQLAAHKAATDQPSTSNDVGSHHRMIAAGRNRKKEEVIPCSIRCPGMTGEIPNLQCTRCLCLYHAHCLGLPPNLSYNNFLCSNCEGQGDQPSTSGGGPSQEMKKPLLMKKPVDMKRQPPPLIRATSLRGGAPRREVMIAPVSRREPARVPQKMPVPMGRGMMRGRGMAAPLTRSPSTFVHPGQHRITVPDGSPGIVGPSGTNASKRGRGRSTASRPLPQLNSKSLTITHLPRILPKPPAGPLPVPNLQPMGAPKGVPSKIAIPVLPVKPRQSMPVVPNLMKSNAFKLTVPPPSLSGRTFKKVPVAPSHPTNLRLNPSLVHRPSAQIFAQGQDKSVSLIKRHPQSIVSVGPKKFIVLPRKSRSEFIPSASHPPPVGNGVSARVNHVEASRSEQKRVSITAIASACAPNETRASTLAKILVPSDSVDGVEAMETETASVNSLESECMNEDQDTSAKICIDSADFAKPGTEQATVSNE